MYQAAEENGFSTGTLKRASRKLGVVKCQEQDSNDQNCWYWALPEDDPRPTFELSQTAQCT